VPNDSLLRKSNFVVQQGFDAPPAASCPTTYSALLFQPRIVGVIAILATVAQSRALFLSLAGLLWWSALLPQWNPFELAYNRFVATRSGLRLGRAPGPRRFAQALAGVISATIAVLLTLGFRTAAIVIELLLIAAIAALVFGGFCVGSYLFHLLRGRRMFANRTLPWAGGA
jgi:Domain of unknown function (DUF4395)